MCLLIVAFSDDLTGCGSRRRDINFVAGQHVVIDSTKKVSFKILIYIE